MGLSEPEFTQSLSQTVPVLTFALILFPARHPTSQVNNRETEIKKIKKTQSIVIYYLLCSVEGYGKKKKNEIHCKLNFLCLAQVCFWGGGGESKLKKERKKGRKNTHWGHI